MSQPSAYRWRLDLTLLPPPPLPHQLAPRPSRRPRTSQGPTCPGRRSTPPSPSPSSPPSRNCLATTRRRRRPSGTRATTTIGVQSVQRSRQSSSTKVRPQAPPCEQLTDELLVCIVIQSAPSRRRSRRGSPSRPSTSGSSPSASASSRNPSDARTSKSSSTTSSSTLSSVSEGRTPSPNRGSSRGT